MSAARCPATRQAAYVIGLGLMQALAHAAPDVPQDKYPELGARYRHHYLAHQDDISLFDGVLRDAGAISRRGTTGWPWPPARAARAWTRRCTRWSSRACSTVRARPMRPPASRTRACCTS